VSTCCFQASRNRPTWHLAGYAAGLLNNAGRAPAKPERGRKTTSTTARSGSSLRCAVARGPCTAASTALLPCAQRADPSARCSGPRSHCTPLRQRVPQQGGRRAAGLPGWQRRARCAARSVALPEQGSVLGTAVYVLQLEPINLYDASPVQQHTGHCPPEIPRPEPQMPGGSTSVDYLSGRWRAATPARSQAQAQRPRCPSCSGLQRSSVTLRASVARSGCTEHKSCVSCNLAALASPSWAVLCYGGAGVLCVPIRRLLFFLPGNLRGASNGGRRCATGAFFHFGSFWHLALLAFQL